MRRIDLNARFIGGLGSSFQGVQLAVCCSTVCLLNIRLVESLGYSCIDQGGGEVMYWVYLIMQGIIELEERMR